MQPNIYRTCYCKDISKAMLDQEVTLSGWVETIRDHGGVLFLDLRDTTEVVQVVSNDDDLFAHLTKESVIRVSGLIRLRSEETYNPKIKTGEVELFVQKLDVLSEAQNVLPFEIRRSETSSEDIRLKYRYLDLRNDKVQQKLKMRHELLHFLRDKM